MSIRDSPHPTIPTYSSIEVVAPDLDNVPGFPEALNKRPRYFDTSILRFDTVFWKVVLNLDNVPGFPEDQLSDTSHFQEKRKLHPFRF